ncbi:bifunctional tetrahydrofolate synthase/dihydrofolate synthase [Atopomonas sediminilitoris]|uniref:bifunctional tetrahydrofolate synthase/dihydrofolate synthase n=1 Tax=Atopomonas sediminilitoris TaxID=2919919 RepID=UPI001F4DA7C0|nr:bifunctional tetrahydrofolate synthase/dihydrofolate synthase [Atopomonas sediminilitoris]MCJ8168791.1 bifunctional tetrahydrofolate synthase/dihydrofolate synthase [Atopomonas sediminilitoris]
MALTANSSLNAWLSYLEQLHPSSIDMGLERLQQVAQRLALGRPAKQVVTVTGTNGKGSTCAFLAELLRAEGLRVGVYTSPHLLRYNERVRVAGELASDSALCAAFAQIEAARGDISLTYFEFGTLAALLLFQAAQLDVAVLEVGLGGRLDAVNLVDADVAVITSIGVDHAEWLGDSRDSVAAEKAGILRAQRPAVCGDRLPPQSLQNKAAELSAPLWVRDQAFYVAWTEQVQGPVWHWQGRSAQGELLELHDLPPLTLPEDNAAVALQAFALLGFSLDQARVASALQAAHVTGRLQVISLPPPYAGRELLLDVGHNPHAMQFIAERLARRPLTGQRHLVFGLLADKDLDGVLAALTPLSGSWAVADLPCVRSRAAQDIAQALTLQGVTASVHADVASALHAQLAKSEAGDQILLLGSFYTVTEAILWLRQQGVDVE